MKKNTKKQYKELLIEEDRSQKQQEEMKEKDPHSFRVKRNSLNHKYEEDQKEEILFNGHCAIKQANLIQRVLFLWPCPVWKAARKRGKLKIEQLGHLRQMDKSEHLTRQLDKYWSAYKGKKGKNLLCKAVLMTFKKEYLMGAFLLLFKTFMSLLTPFFMYRLLNFLENSEDQDYLKGLLLIFSMLFTQYGEYLFNEHSSIFNDFVGRRGRTALMGIISQKTLSISPSAEKTFTQGQIQNRCSVDAYKIQGISSKIGEMLSLPVLLTIAIFSLYKLIGLSFLAGMGVFLVTIVITLGMARWFQRIQKELMKAADQRMEVTTQVINSMKTIKMAAWEKDFQKRIKEKRDYQLRVLRKRQKFAVLNHLIYCLAPFLISASSFGVYMKLGNQISPSIAYTVVMMFNVIRNPLNRLPWMISEFIETFVSIKRIQDFLQQEDVDPNKVQKLPNDAFAYAMAIQNASFTWKMKQEESKEKK